MIACVNDGQVELYYNNTAHLKTTGEGIDVHNVDDAVLTITTTGTDAHDDARLELITQESAFKFQNDRSLGTDGGLTFKAESDNGITILKDGGVELYYDNVKKAETTSIGLNIGNHFASQGASTTAQRIWLEGTSGVVIRPNLAGAGTNNTDGQFIRACASANAIDNDDVVKFVIYATGDTQNANNSYAGFSDVNLKQDIVDAGSQWDDIKNLRVRKYRFKNNPTGPLQIGCIAQEAETVSPGLVDTDPDEGFKSLKYSVLYMKAIKALQEAITKIETLETKVAALEAK